MSRWAAAVKDGKAELVLPRDSVQVFHCTRPALVGKAIVTLQINDCKAKPGEALYVIGDCRSSAAGIWIGRCGWVRKRQHLVDRRPVQ